MRRTTTAALTAVLFALSGCSSSGSDAEPGPTVTATATVTEPPALSEAEQTQLCVDAVADVISSRPAGFDPETGEDPKPAECNHLSESDYLDAYMEGLFKSNEAALEERQRQRDEAELRDQQDQ
ncbi:hypothetical protein [Streptomyces wuyuanensis]|uniref:Secreted protein n=1 Tax=Streptomyces wuyuanensis TaxID=1196353 RepID=A0A1G9ZAD5_9ACTN|nr:hypothetical protein [Streptomyces wuyuanensis]SDN18057.1 hypothetical protein SAMN05444921_12137 [Streptomyces wuyuanensis]